ncbi:MAG: AbrB family transcriptional regulator [Thermoleophilaceae bacterium]
MGHDACSESPGPVRDQERLARAPEAPPAIAATRTTASAATGQAPQGESERLTVRGLAPLIPLGALAVAAGGGLELAGLPSGYLFAALLVGLGVALLRPRNRIAIPRPAFYAAQATLGVLLGTYLDPSSLSAVADDWLAIGLVSLGTLLLSVAVGAVLTRSTALDDATGTLGMVAGGASGIVAMADELGADARLVAFMQYLRVLVVVLTIPLIVALAFPVGEGRVVPGDDALLGEPLAWLAVPAIAFVGAFAGRMTRLPAATLLGPLILAGTISLSLPVDLTVPPLLREVAFGLIGLEVGLRFTVATVRNVGRLLLPVLAAIVVLMAVSFLFAVGLAAATAATLMDGYLATTPGGLYAVLAVGFAAGANTTFIVAVQVLRLITLVILAPFVVRWVVRRVG